LVHASEKGELAVVAVMYEQGKKNQALDGLWQQYRQPQKVFNLNADQFLPTHREHYRFNGSLTTPPCTEGVRWVVLKDIQQASAQQIANFA
ncbi:carbonic anhydrase family protein, partial [bacterium LRH843]|nr:carbonic anhydrase family protein [bacterium LRH843]